MCVCMCVRVYRMCLSLDAYEFSVSSGTYSVASFFVGSNIGTFQHGRDTEAEKILSGMPPVRILPLM